MYPKVNYALVGLFVLVLGAAIGSTVLWLATKGREGSYHTYVAYTRESVAGLNPNAPVKYRGVDVGQVRSISLDPGNSERVQILLDIRDGTPVKRDTLAVLSSRGFITGLTYIELKGGSRDAPPIEAGKGERYPEIVTSPSLYNRIENAIPDMLSRFDGLITQLSVAVERVDAVLSDENRQAVSHSLHNVEEFTSVLASRKQNLEQILDQLAVASANGARVSEQLPQIADRLGKTMEATQKGLEAVSRAADRVDKLAGGADQAVDHFSRGTLNRADQLLRQLQELTQSLQRVTQQLEREPGSLVFGRTQPRRGPGE